MSTLEGIGPVEQRLRRNARSLLGFHQELANKDRLLASRAGLYMPRIIGDPGTLVDPPLNLFEESYLFLT